DERMTGDPAGTESVAREPEPSRPWRDKDHTSRGLRRIARSQVPAARQSPRVGCSGRERIAAMLTGTPPVPEKNSAAGRPTPGALVAAPHGHALPRARWFLAAAGAATRRREGLPARHR